MKQIWAERLLGHARSAHALDDPWAVAACAIEMEALVSAIYKAVQSLKAAIKAEFESANALLPESIKQPLADLFAHFESSIVIVGDAALAQSCPVKMDRKNCRRPYGCRVYCGGGASLTQRKPVCDRPVSGDDFMRALGR